MTNKRKILLTLGATLGATIPIATIVSCGTGSGTDSGANNKTPSTPPNKENKDLTKYKQNILNKLGSNEDEQLKNGLSKIKSSGPVTVTESNNAYLYTLPNFATFSGAAGNANLDTNFTSKDSAINSKLDIKYYSLAKGSKSNKTSVVDHGSTKTAWNVKDGDSVFVKITPNDGKTINGQSSIVQKFTVSGLTTSAEGSPYYQYYVGDDSTPGVYKKLASKQASYDDVFKLMNLMKPGDVIQKGSYKLKLPNITAKVDAPAAAIPSSAAIPFVDVSMATSGKPNLDAFMKYKYMSFGFIAGATNSNNVRSGKWASTTDLGDPNIVSIINAIRSKGGDFIPSIGGLNETGNAIWENADPVILARWIELLALQFHLQRIDYDIEGQQLSSKSREVYAIATALAQKKLAQDGHKLELTLTIAAEWNGLAHDGIDTLNTFVNAGANITKLNGMTMMMNPAEVKKLGGLAGAVKNSVTSMKDQLKNAYKQSGLTLTDAQAYQKVGTTIDISTDTWVGERFTVDELQKILKFAQEKKIGQLSYWSAGNEDPGINGLGMSLDQWVVIAKGLGIPTAGQTKGALQKAIIAKLNGQLPAYGVYKQFDAGGAASTDTVIPSADSKVLTGVNNYANATLNSRGSVFDRVNFNLPTYAEAKAKSPSGLPGGTKVTAKGLGGIVHIFRAKFWATTAPWPFEKSAQWEDLGIALSSSDLDNTLAIAQTINDTYSSNDPTYIRAFNPDGTANTKPNKKSSNPALSSIQTILNNNSLLNIKEFSVSDLSRNHFVKGDLAFMDNKVYMAKWDNGGLAPKGEGTALPPAWDPNYTPLL